jgi:hypothetical protein
VIKIVPPSILRKVFLFLNKEYAMYGFYFEMLRGNGPRNARKSVAPGADFSRAILDLKSRFIGNADKNSDA